MNNVLKKYLSEASTFMSDETISEGTKVDKNAAAVVIATEGKKEPTPASVATKQAKINKLRKSTIKEEGEEEADSDKLEEEEDITIDEEETEDGESCNEDEDDGAEDGEICEGEDDGMGEEEEGDEMADDDQIEDPKKKKVDIKESYIAHASRWM